MVDRHKYKFWYEKSNRFFDSEDFVIEPDTGEALSIETDETRGDK